MSQDTNDSSIIDKVVTERRKQERIEREREELTKAVNELKQRGWKTDKLEKLLESDLDEFRKELLIFRKRMQRLHEIANQLPTLKTNLYGREVQAIETRLNDPYSLSYIERKLEQLKGSSKKPSEVDFSIDLQNYYNTLIKRFDEYQPRYSPLGKWFKGGKWNVEHRREEYYIKGTLNYYLSPKLVIESALLQKNLQKLENEISKDADNAYANERYIARNYVASDIPQNLLRYFEKFQHPNFSPYLLDIENKALIYNTDELKTRIFSEWFKLGGEPMDIIKILKMISDHHNIFTFNDLKNELNMNKKEGTKLVHSLMDDDKLVKMSMVEYGVVS